MLISERQKFCTLVIKFEFNFEKQTVQKLTKYENRNLLVM